MMILCFSLDYWSDRTRHLKTSPWTFLVFPHISLSRIYHHQVFFFYNFKYIYWCLTKSISYWSTKCWLWHCHRTKTCNRPNNQLEDGVWLWWFAALTWAMQTFSGGRKLFWPWPWTFPQPNLSSFGANSTTKWDCVVVTGATGYQQPNHKYMFIIICD